MPGWLVLKEGLGQRVSKTGAAGGRGGGENTATHSVARERPGAGVGPRTPGRGAVSPEGVCMMAAERGWIDTNYREAVA